MDRHDRPRRQSRPDRTIPTIELLEGRLLPSFFGWYSASYNQVSYQAAIVRHDYDQYVSELKRIELASQATPAEYLALRDDARAISLEANGAGLPRTDVQLKAVETSARASTVAALRLARRRRLDGGVVAAIGRPRRPGRPPAADLADHRRHADPGRLGRRRPGRLRDVHQRLHHPPRRRAVVAVEFGLPLRGPEPLLHPAPPRVLPRLGRSEGRGARRRSTATWPPSATRPGRPRPAPPCSIATSESSRDSAPPCRAPPWTPSTRPTWRPSPRGHRVPRALLAPVEPDRRPRPGRLVGSCRVDRSTRHRCHGVLRGCRIVVGRCPDDRGRCWYTRQRGRRRNAQSVPDHRPGDSFNVAGKLTPPDA